jgi:IS605 OrfB family transposase
MSAVSGYAPVDLRRALLFPLPPEGLPVSVSSLLSDYRLVVNRLLRFAIASQKTARGSIAREAAEAGREERIHGQHATTAASVALSLARGHRRRVHALIPSKIPYVRRPFLRADDSTFHFDLDSGRIRLALRAGDWAGFVVQVPRHHRELLEQDGVRVKQLVLTPTRIVLIYAKEAPVVYSPKSLLAFDTNESSLDGVHLASSRARKHRSGFVRVSFPDIRRIQTCAFLLRGKLGHQKAHDRRLSRLLLGKVGRREHHRVQQRLHMISKRIVEIAEARHAAIALEQLSRPLERRRRGGGRWGRRVSGVRGRSLRRRLSNWPRGELHRQIAYKAEERGVPVYFVDPRYTSKACPVCGVIQDRRSRVGAVFECAACGWRLDRQLNAGLNVARTALVGRPELAGLRLAPDALPKDVVNSLYSPTTVGAHGASGREGRDPPTHGYP